MFPNIFIIFPLDSQFVMLMLSKINVLFSSPESKLIIAESFISPTFFILYNLTLLNCAFLFSNLNNPYPFVIISDTETLLNIYVDSDPINPFS